MITKWLKDRTPEERENNLKTQISFPLKKLRQHQDIVRAQRALVYTQWMDSKKSQFQHIRDNADTKYDPIMENLDIMDDDLIEAIDRKCFK